MAIISQGGRKNLKTSFIYFFMYFFLISGAITMVYPFALMVSGSFANNYDFNDHAMIPRYIYDDDALMKKYLFDKYGNLNFKSLVYKYGKDSQWNNWDDIRQENNFIKEVYQYEATASCKQLDDYFLFLKGIPADQCSLYYENDMIFFQNFLSRKYSGDINELNKKWNRSFNNFDEIRPLVSMLLEQRWYPLNRQDMLDYIECIKTAPCERIHVVSINEMWIDFLFKKYNLPINYKHKKIKNFSEVALEGAPDRNEFIKNGYPLRLVTVNGQGMPDDFAQRSMWMDHTLKLPITSYELNSIDRKYHIFLKNKYHNINNLNHAWQSNFESFDFISMPFKLVDYHYFVKNKSQIRNDYILNNYKNVWYYLATKGRAIPVTLTLIMLSILCALTINPLAAYALSCGSQSLSVKILIFFLATMAFPAEVGMIPGFLLIRDLGLLNTMGALLLPGLANGYSIFLLKGFFDSIPRELYEAAEIDGANEITKFLRITYPMSKPILAVIALGAFTSAYSGFMWAFLSCQDPDMWTMMVWIYDFQSVATNQGEVFASLVIAAIPTLVVFIFCQKMIMRGIIIPSMK